VALTLLLRTPALLRCRDESSESEASDGEDAGAAQPMQPLADDNLDAEVGCAGLLHLGLRTGPAASWHLQAAAAQDLAPRP
jgi:hypothetical protein